MGFFTLGYTNLDLERKQRNIPLKRTLLIGVLKSSFIFSPFQTTGQTFLTKFIFCRVFLQTCHVLMTRSAALHSKVFHDNAFTWEGSSWQSVVDPLISQNNT